MVKKLEKNTLIKCPWCLKSSTLEDWDNGTYNLCLNRQMKRDFKHLDDSKSWSVGAKVVFKCPKCSQWSRSNKLKITNPSNEDESKLGGDSLLEVKNSEEN